MRNQTDLMGNPTEEPTIIHNTKFSLFLQIVKGIDLFSFFIANFVLFGFFKIYLPGGEIYIYLIMAGLSLIVIKTQSVFHLVYYIADKFNSDIPKQKQESENKSKWRDLSPKLWMISIFICIKQAFFNVAYYLFPVLLVWLSVAGIFYVFGGVQYHPHQNFFEVITILSISLAIFQYFLKRHEEKIATKIAVITKKIGDIINQSTTFEEYYKTLGTDEDSEKLKKWITRNIDPKLLVQDFLSTIAENKETLRLFERIMKPSKAKVPFQLAVSYPESNKKYEILEWNANEKNTQKKELVQSYRRFFANEALYEEILEKIEHDIDVDEFGMLTISNINIIHEISPEFIQFQLRGAIGTLFSKSCSDPFTENLEKATEFRDALSQKIWVKIFQKIF